MASPTRDDAQLMIQIAQWGTSLGIEEAMPRIFAGTTSTPTRPMRWKTARYGRY